VKLSKSSTAYSAVIGDPIKEEDKVVYLLGSLPKNFDMLVTALEANTDVPNMETVIEKVQYEEQKLKRKNDEKKDAGLITKKQYSKSANQKNRSCYYCGKPGHFIRKCCQRMIKEENVNTAQNNEENN